MKLRQKQSNVIMTDIQICRWFACGLCSHKMHRIDRRAKSKSHASLFIWPSPIVSLLYIAVRYHAAGLDSDCFAHHLQLFRTHVLVCTYYDL